MSNFYLEDYKFLKSKCCICYNAIEKNECVSLMDAGKITQFGRSLRALLQLSRLPVYGASCCMSCCQDVLQCFENVTKLNAQAILTSRRRKCDTLQACLAEGCNLCKNKSLSLEAFCFHFQSHVFKGDAVLHRKPQESDGDHFDIFSPDAGKVQKVAKKSNVNPILPPMSKCCVCYKNIPEKQFIALRAVDNSITQFGYSLKAVLLLAQPLLFGTFCCMSCVQDVLECFQTLLKINVSITLTNRRKGLATLKECVLKGCSICDVVPSPPTLDAFSDHFRQHVINGDNLRAVVDLDDENEDVFESAKLFTQNEETKVTPVANNWEALRATEVSKVPKEALCHICGKVAKNIALHVTNAHVKQKDDTPKRPSTSKPRVRSPKKKKTSDGNDDDEDAPHHQCGICGVVVKTKRGLSQHTTLKHTKPMRTDSGENDEQDKRGKSRELSERDVSKPMTFVGSIQDDGYQCSECRLKFPCRSLYDKHLEVHHGVGPGGGAHYVHNLHAPSSSQFTSSSSSTSLSHSTSHLISPPKEKKELPIVPRPVLEAPKEFGNSICTLCGKAFSSAHYLTKHQMKYHPEEFRIRCHYCESTFRDSDELENHLRVIHGLSVVVQSSASGESKSEGRVRTVIQKKTQYPIYNRAPQQSLAPSWSNPANGAYDTRVSYPAAAFEENQVYQHQTVDPDGVGMLMDFSRRLGYY